MTSGRDGGHTAGPTHISESFAQALGALIDASHHLPVCDRAAKLDAALTRLANAEDKPAACEAARALAAASQLALEDDPWFRFHRAANEAVATLCAA
jgi:hypothetical protein